MLGSFFYFDYCVLNLMVVNLYTLRVAVLIACSTLSSFLVSILIVRSLEKAMI